MSSTTVLAKALYSDSVDDRETVFCFRADHETRLDPRYIAYPPVDRRSSEQPAESEKTLRGLEVASV